MDGDSDLMVEFGLDECREGCIEFCLVGVKR